MIQTSKGNATNPSQQATSGKQNNSQDKGWVNSNPDGKTSLTKNGKTFWWCTKKHNGGKGQWVLHKPEDHDDSKCGSGQSQSGKSGKRRRGKKDKNGNSKKTGNSGQKLETDLRHSLAAIRTGDAAKMASFLATLESSN